jgi:hypothetical protein
MFKIKLYYTLKPIIPRLLQIFARRQMAKWKRKKYAHIWPIDPSAAKAPEFWPGWPEGKKFALLLCHDADSQKGHDNCMKMADLESSAGFISYFNFVPERYKNSDSLHTKLREKGFGIGVHGLKHDGKLFSSRRIFDQRSDKINYYLKKWESAGFTSPSMHRNLDWLQVLNISHSTSTFDTDPFEPQPDAAGTIFPFWISNGDPSTGYLELPYTLPQDHLIFIILKEKNIDIWKKKLDWIVEHGGMALLNTHADYINFDGSPLGNEEYPVSYYKEFLDYIKEKYAGQYWNVLPGDVAQFWKEEVSAKA